MAERIAISACTAATAHICAGTAPTSARGQRPHLRRDSAHICAGTAPTSCCGTPRLVRCRIPHLRRDRRAHARLRADLPPCRGSEGQARRSLPVQRCGSSIADCTTSRRSSPIYRPFRVADSLNSGRDMRVTRTHAYDEHAMQNRTHTDARARMRTPPLARMHQHRTTQSHIYTHRHARAHNAHPACLHARAHA